MKYVGIDIGKTYHYASILDEENNATEPFRFNSLREGYELFLLCLEKYKCAKEETIIALEATRHYWLPLFEKLKLAGYTVYVLNPLVVDSYRNENIRGTKTDEIDCKLIAKIVRFGTGRPTNLPSENLFQLRELCRFRSDLRKRTTVLKLKILTILDQVFPEYGTIFKDIFCKTSTEILKEYKTVNDIADEDLVKLTRAIQTISRKQFNEKEAVALRDKAKTTFGLRFGLDAFSLELRCLLEQLEHLEQQITLLEKEIEIAVDQQNTQLTSIPGVSKVGAGTILGETVSYNKENPDPRSFLAYAGLEPKIKKSGIWVGKMKMSKNKRGSPYLREAIYRTSLYAAFHEPMFEKIYKKHRGRGKLKMVALTFVYKKMAYVVASILRTNKPYHPETEVKEEKR
jgi:transposase